MTTSGGNNGATVLALTWKPRPGDPQNDRLRAAMLDAQRRLTALAEKLGAQDRIVKACWGRLKLADEEAANARYVAWDCLHQFDAEILAAMSNEERQAHWCTLRAEAKEKLKGWRSEAADCLVKQAPAVMTPATDATKPAAEDTSVPLHLVAALQAQLAIAAQNQQHKLELFTMQSLRSLTISLGAAVAVALAFSMVVFMMERYRFLLPWAKTLVLGISAGALGGIVSMAFSLGRVDLKAKIPDTRLSRSVTLTRPLLGATVAIPILFFINAGYVTVKGFEGPLGVFAFCFLGGFSERWFLSLLERFEGGKK